MESGRQIASEQFAAPMHFGVALAAKGLQVHRVIGAAVFDFDDVMHLQLNGGTEALEVVFSAEAVPAVIPATCWKQRAQVFV